VVVQFEFATVVPSERWHRTVWVWVTELVSATQVAVRDCGIAVPQPVLGDQEE
jgi:hypothetical protein